jgi:PHD/YefM family antitoxin component YafN of YafNO toxin-antitoxin module
MSIRTAYADARARFAGFCDAATTNREIIIIQRRSAEDVALIAADELANLLETAHLLARPGALPLLMIGRLQSGKVVVLVRKCLDIPVVLPCSLSE